MPVFCHVPTFQSSTEDTVPCVALPTLVAPVLVVVVVEVLLLVNPLRYSLLLRKDESSVRLSTVK